MAFAVRSGLLARGSGVIGLRQRLWSLACAKDSGHWLAPKAALLAAFRGFPRGILASHFPLTVARQRRFRTGFPESIGSIRFDLRRLPRPGAGRQSGGWAPVRGLGASPGARGPAAYFLGCRRARLRVHVRPTGSAQASWRSTVRVHRCTSDRLRPQAVRPARREMHPRPRPVVGAVALLNVHLQTRSPVGAAP
jgi:hypothetical protein